MLWKRRFQKHFSHTVQLWPNLKRWNWNKNRLHLHRQIQSPVSVTVHQTKYCNNISWLQHR
jgi:hypothetical protein